MKKTFLISIIFYFTATFTNHAQEKSYLGIGSGINNISSVLGVTYENPINSNFSIKLGAGIGSWGYKAGLSGKYYSSFPSSMAFGLGYSTATGGKGLEMEVELNNTLKQKELIDLSQAHMIDLTMCKSWGEKVKFNIEFGYSIKISGGEAKLQNPLLELSDVYKTSFNLISPGGLIFGLGLTFVL
jgi:hypothetical protein